MSEASNVAEQSALICVAALAFATAPTLAAGAAFLAPVAVLTTIGMRLRNSCAKRTCDTAIKAALTDLQANPEFRERDFTRAKTLLEYTKRPINLTPTDLVEAADPEEFSDNLATILLEGVDFQTGDDVACTILTLAFRRCVDVARQDAAFRAELTETLLLDLSQEAKQQTATLSRLEEKIDLLTAQLETSEVAAKAREVGVSEAALLRLVRPIAEDVEDVQSAMVELANAVNIAVRVQEEGRHRSNLGDFVDEVLHRTAELSAQGDNDTASAKIDDALKQEEAESTARRMRLLDRGIEYDLLRRDPESAARRIVQKADLEAGGQAEFAALRVVCHEWMTRGRDKGLVLDQEVAIALAEIIVTRATTDLERGIAFDDLGITLQERGTPERGTDKLSRSIKAYDLALKSWPREKDPMRWATTQNNLGNALSALGERESGTDRLEQAVTAFREALKERSRDRSPLLWASTQNNLGTALRPLGERLGGTKHLEEAVAAYREALKERTRNRVPLDWAMTQNNLGNALSSLGERQRGAQNLQLAVTAYQEALRERTRGRVPLSWAQTNSNLAIVEVMLFDMTGSQDHLDCAEEYLKAAREVFADAGATYYLEIADSIAAKIAQRRASTEP